MKWNWKAESKYHDDFNQKEELGANDVALNIKSLKVHVSWA